MMWLFATTLLLFIVIKTNTVFSNQHINEFYVNILPDNINFYYRKDVIKLIKNDLDLNARTTLNDINIDETENTLKNETHVKAANVYIDYQGNFNIQIVQHTPLVRIYNYRGENFYIDKEGLKIPTSSKFMAHAIIANGNIFERYGHKDSLYSYAAKEVYKIATYVDKDEFLKAQIEQIFVEADGTFSLIPKAGNHTILLGNATNLDEKFNKLKVFYKEGLNKIGWHKYSKINLKYKNQVICTR